MIVRLLFVARKQFQGKAAKLLAYNVVSSTQENI